MKEVKSRICKRCGDVFEPVKHTQQICDKEHFKKCSNCGKAYSWEKRGVTCSSQCAGELRKKSAKNVLVCQLCGDSFKSVKSNAKYCSKVHYKKCAVCKKDMKIDFSKMNQPTCSPACGAKYTHNDESRIKRRKNNLEKYGVEYTFQREEVKEKIKNNPNHQSSLIGSEKFKQTMLEKYGVENFSELGKPEMRGVNNPMNNPKIKEKFYSFMMEKYGVRTPLEVPEFLEKAQKSISGCGVNSKTGRISNVNKTFFKELKDRFPDSRVELEFYQSGFSFDVAIPDERILIEINPTITHNVNVGFACLLKKCSLPCEVHKSLPRDYHFKKAKLAKELGYRLIQIYDWTNKEKIFSFIEEKIRKDVVKVSARKCSLRKVSLKESKAFLNAYHIQGAGRGSENCYGVYHNDELIAVGTFSKSRFSSKYESEFLRYAVKKGFVLYGGAGFIFKEFCKEFNPETVVSYIDFNHTTGKVFLENLGFEEIKPTGPAAVWWSTKEKKKISGTSLLQIGADRLLGTDYGSKEESGLDNDGIMLIEGYLKVFTAGNRVFVWGRKSPQ